MVAALRRSMILGLDIGGANTKAASSDGRIGERIYLPLWKGAPLGAVLDKFAKLEPDAVAVVMTGELADCYSNKLSGVMSIKSAVEAAFNCPVHFWGVSGFDWKETIDLAASNWYASASLIAKEMGDCIFADMGSTTTDLIPIRGKPLAAKTDYKRLINGELIYTGMLRTNLCALLREAMIQGDVVPLSSELFAITADAYLALDRISEEGYTCDTPDGAGMNRDASLRRLSRTVCADLEEIGEAGALAIAEQAYDRQHNILVNAIQRLAKRHDLSVIAASGVGEDIIARAAHTAGMGCTRLSERYGRKVSDIFPAYAVARLLSETI
jgi:probable H4MPT-linked C1 transfer pathway protein